MCKRPPPSLPKLEEYSFFNCCHRFSVSETEFIDSSKLYRRKRQNSSTIWYILWTPTSNEKLLAHKIVDEKEEKKVEQRRTNDAEKDKEYEEDELRKIKNPLLVRCEIEWFENAYASN